MGRLRSQEEEEERNVYTSDSHENTVGRVRDSLPVDVDLLLIGDGDLGESSAPPVEDIPLKFKTHKT